MKNNMVSEGRVDAKFTGVSGEQGGPTPPNDAGGDLQREQRGSNDDGGNVLFYLLNQTPSGLTPTIRGRMNVNGKAAGKGHGQTSAR